MENKFIYDALVKNLYDKKCLLVPHSQVNLYLTSFKLNDMSSIEENNAAAKEIERVSNTKMFLEEVAMWSKGQAENPVIMADLSDDGLIDVNLQFTVK